MADQLFVYLDHHIRRENLRYKRPDTKFEKSADKRAPTLRLRDLLDDDHMLITNLLRKPDFQRATWAWTPEACVSLLQSIINEQVIPSIIMWTSPDNNLMYVLDGGHRISAIMAWLKSDWGGSQAKGMIDPEQADSVKKAANAVEHLVQSKIGTFDEYVGADEELTDLISNDISHPRKQLGEKKWKQAIFLQNLRKGDVSFPILWVDGNYETAEQSFIKINRSGTPLSDWEIKLVENRDSSFARTIMSIASVDNAEHYWPAIVEPKTNDEKELNGRVQQILERANYIQSIVLTPPHSRPITTLRQALLVAIGEKKPYYIAELITVIQGLRGLEVETEELMLRDKDASEEKIVQNGLAIIDSVAESLSHIVGDNRTNKSMGIIPLLYFYKSDGSPIRSLLYGFLYWILYGNEDEIRQRKIIFCAHRGAFEKVFREYKDQIVHGIAQKVGSGPEVTTPTAEFFQQLLEILVEFPNVESEDFINSFSNLLQNLPGQSKPKVDPKNIRVRLFTSNQKSTAIIDILIDGLATCEICGGKIDPNSGIQHDHRTKYTDGGTTTLDNHRLTHVFCNQLRDKIEQFREDRTGSSLPAFEYKTETAVPQQFRLPNFE